MPLDSLLILAALVFVAAALYSSVGHAGASGYLAAMAIMGLSPGVMKPSALILNIVVASLASVQFVRAGCFSWRLFWPFALMSIPLAFVGGTVTLPASVYKPAVGLILLFAASRLLWIASRPAAGATKPPPIPLALGVGGGLGLLAGLTGTGGGIFLSPVMVLCRWAEPKQVAGVSVVFILVNSIAGLVGSAPKLDALPSGLWAWAAAAVVGGAIGSRLGSTRLASPALRRLLACVLIIAGTKLVIEGARAWA